MTKTIVKVGMASCGVAAGARPVFDTLSTLLDGRDDVVLKQVGCVGLCFSEPLVEIEREGVRSLYGKVTPDFA